MATVRAIVSRFSKFFFSTFQRRLQFVELLVVDKKNPLFFGAHSVVLVSGISLAELDLRIAFLFIGLVQNLNFKRRLVQPVFRI